MSLDALVFEDGERGPDERLRLQFEAICQLEPKEREALETVIAGVLHMHDAKRWTTASPIQWATRYYRVRRLCRRSG